MRNTHAVLCLALVSCAVEEPELSTETSELATCVPYVGHWNFWGACSGDVPLGAGSPVYSLSSGQVVQVYASCGGYAGRSVRVDYGDGRYMYAHINSNVGVGQWLSPGSLVGWVYGGAGPVYCNSSLTTCGVGWSSTRQTLCWSGPHLHREGNCCGASDCNSGYSVIGAIRDKWISLGGCGWGSPETNEGAAAYGGRFSHFNNGGSIYWTPWTGAHEVHGRIREHWAWLGWEWSWLGYPITDEYQHDGTPYGMNGWVAESEFEGGWLSYEFATGNIIEWPRW